MLGSLNNWNIIQFTNKTTKNKDFDEVHDVVLDSISHNTSALVQNGKYVAINTLYPTTIGYYVVKLLSEPYMLKDDKTVDNKVIKSGELTVKKEYLSIIKANTNWYWKQLVTKGSVILVMKDFIHMIFSFFQ